MPRSGSRHGRRRRSEPGPASSGQTGTMQRRDAGNRPVACYIPTHQARSSFAAALRLSACPHFAEFGGHCHLPAFCYLNARQSTSTPGFIIMPTSDQADAPLPEDPALLRIEGPVATITLNRPAAFNSIDLTIAR